MCYGDVGTRFVAIAAVVGLWACSPAASQGTVAIRISDHRDAIGDFSSFNVEIKSIELRSASSEEWIKLQPQQRSVDLTQVVGEQAEQVLEAALPSGRYDAVRVRLTDVGGLLLSGERVHLEDFTTTSRLEFHLASDKTVRLRIDLKVQSQHDHPGGGYELILGDAIQDSTE